MNRLVSLMLILSLVVPVNVFAGMTTDFDPVEKDLIQKKALEEEMSREFKKSQAEQPVTAETKKKAEAESGGSNWWKWALGILVIGGIAAAAGGGGGGGGSSSGSTGSISSTW